VSVAESIDSSTAHGKMLIGILATFAEYERSLASARTRDKIRGAKQKGRFCGGAPVLGFDCDPKGAQLVVNAAEATMVREIFELFLANKSLVATVAEMDRRGWTLKKWVTRAGKEFGGGRVDVHNLRRLLGNHVYEGRVLFEGKLYDGEHAAIVSSKVFHEVQRILDAGRRDTRPGAANKYGCLLRGLLFCGCGSPMVHAPTKKGHRVHRYYRCGATMRRGAATCPTRALRALDIESFVVGRIRAIGQDASLRGQTFREAVDQLAAQKRSLNREAKRLTRGLAATERHVEDLVATLSRATGPVAEAVEAEIAKAKTRTAAAEERLRTVRAEAGGLGAVSIDEADLARALADFDGLWSVLLTAERERLLGVLISAVRYDGANGRLEIDWRLAGFGELAAEVTGA